MTGEKAQQTRVITTAKTVYDQQKERFNKRKEESAKGKRLLKGKDIPWEQNRQGKIRWYAADAAPGLAADTMTIFANEIKTHGGRHTHQGGVNIFVLRGKGHSIVDGVRHDWEAGDLIMLPIKKGGCEHQHFNLDSEPSRWLALRSRPLREVVGHFSEQKEEHPDWKE